MYGCVTLAMPPAMETSELSQFRSGVTELELNRSRPARFRDISNFGLPVSCE